MIPKDEGNRIMVSAIQSREFGFGLELTLDESDIVNNLPNPSAALHGS